MTELRFRDEAAILLFGGILLSSGNLVAIVSAGILVGMFILRPPLHST